MKFQSLLGSNHDLKKNGYKIFRKLHKMETRRGANKAYLAPCGNTYFFVVSCRALVDIIVLEYPDAEQFIDSCNKFLQYLDYVAQNKCTIDRSILSSFLSTYTQFFNHIIKEKHHFRFTEEMIELWNLKCLMAYIATWGNV